MTADLLLLLLGLVLLLGGGETLVRGSTGLAQSLGVSPLVIGLTVVAFGTSAPELAVNVIAAWRDRPGISFGNIFGSNMANIGLIVGCAALIRPILIHGVVVRRELPMMLLATAAAGLMALDPTLGGGGRAGLFSRSDGLLLLLYFLVFLYYTVGEFARRKPPPTEAHVMPAAGNSVARHLLMTAGGLAALVGGAHLTVEAAVVVARALGISEVVIGMTVVAIGTSLPELVASVVATLRGHAELAIGNVVGSNIFNLLLVLGLTALVRPIPVPPGGLADLVVVGGLSAVLMAVSLSRARHIVRTEASLLLIAYFSYVTWRSLSGAV